MADSMISWISILRKIAKNQDDPIKDTITLK